MRHISLFNLVCSNNFNFEKKKCGKSLVSIEKVWYCSNYVSPRRVGRHMAGAIYGFWKRKTVCRKIPNHVIEAVRTIEDRQQIEHDQ